MGRIISLEEGIQSITTSVETINERPILIAVYGKSYLIRRLARNFRQKGISTNEPGSAPSSSTFTGVRDYPNTALDIYLFHCAWLRSDSKAFERFRGHEDPNILAGKILNRNLNLNVYIYNPSTASQILINSIEHRLYDLIIQNPH